MAADKKQITRNRISLSCQTCRRRKVKCSKSHPVCDSCRKAGEECVWGEPNGESHDQANEQQADNHNENRKRKALESVDSDREDRRPDQSSLAVRAIEHKLAQLTALMHDANRLTPISNDNSPKANGDICTTSRSDPDTDLETASAPSKLPSSAYNDQPWLRILDKLDRMNDLMRSSIGAKPPASDCTPAGYETRGTWSKNIDHISQRFSMPWDMNSDGTHDGFDRDQLAPSEEEANVLFRIWLWSSFPVLPLVSPHTVLRKYQAFFQWYRVDMDKGLPNPDPSFMPFLASMWYVAHLSMSTKTREQWFPWVKNYHAQRLRAKLVQCVEAMKKEGESSVWYLAASITSQYVALEGQDNMVNQLRNTTNVRTAQSLGLHNQKSSKGLGASDAEMRKRLWWEVVTQDVSLSAVSGMPPALNECYTDVGSISDLKDTLLGSAEAIQYEQHLQEPESRADTPDDPTDTRTASFVSVYYLVAKARYVLTQATRQVVNANMRAQPMTMDELKKLRLSLLRTSNEVNKIITSIPTRGVPELDFMPLTKATITGSDHLECMADSITDDEIKMFLRETSEKNVSPTLLVLHRATTAAFHRWARIMLSMLLDRLDCVSYAPFLKNSKSRLWAVARNCALKSCHGFMRKFLTLAEDPELERFRWIWQATFQPMHAVIILLIDLHDRPHSDESPRSRAMIDRMFLLSGKINGSHNIGLNCAMPLREGGQEAWEMLIKLRHKAWLKSGLDPDVIWSEEDQMAVGIGKPLSENDLFVRSLREDIIFSHKERQKRTKLEGQDSAPLTIYDLPEEIRHARQKQRLHPSELGPGETISGPVTRGLADLNLHEAPPGLLFRARCDQPIMPAPLTMTLPQHAMGSATGLDHGQLPHMKKPGVQSLNIGELIHKIRHSRPQEENIDTTLPADQSASQLRLADPLQYTSSQDPGCNFRNTQTMMEAAYQDIMNKETPSEQLPSLHNISTSEIRPNGIHGFVPTVHPSTSSPNYLEGPDRTTEMYQQSVERSQTLPESLSMSASIPPTLHSRSIEVLTHLDAEKWWGSGNVPSDAEVRNMQSLLPHEDNARASQSDSQTQQSFQAQDDTQILGEDHQMDFDWDRWDELFGADAGFEDMMLEVATEAAAADAAHH